MAILCMIGTWLLVGAILTALDFATMREKTWQTALGLFVSNTLLVNLFTLFVLRFVFGRAKIVDPIAYVGAFMPKYTILALGFGLLFLILKFAARGTLSVKPDHGPMSVKRKVLLGISVLLALLGSLFLFGSWWFRDFYGDMTTEQFLFNFASPVGGADEGSMLDIYSRPVFLLVFTVGILVYLLFVPAKLIFTTNKKQAILTRSTRQIVVMSMCALLCVGGGAYAWKQLNVPEIIRQYATKSTYIQDNYVDPKTVKLTFPEKKRNLVHIYFESAETGFLDKANGGYMDQNLMPDLMELANTGVHFTNTDYPFGGPHQVYGSSWSVAGYVNMTMGIPLKAPNLQSYGLDGTFLPGATGYTDILAANGYNETVMFGADAYYYGAEAFYSTHGTQKVFDLKYARKEGLVPEDYYVWWGVEDNKLYEFAKAELTRLAGEDKPFCFMFENADTHFPDGFVEPDTEDLFGNQYANVIFHSQKQITDFVKWIQEQPFGPDTTIVITGDHLSMDPNFFKDWDPTYERTTFNCFINPAFPNKNFQTKNRQYAPFDYFPTIMSSLGITVDGERLGLGTNLASDKQTLIERDGLGEVQDQTSMYSSFYTENLLTKNESK